MRLAIYRLMMKAGPTLWALCAYGTTTSVWDLIPFRVKVIAVDMLDGQDSHRTLAAETTAMSLVLIMELTAGHVFSRL